MAKWVNLPMTSNKRDFLVKTGVPHTVYFTNNSTTLKLINEPVSYFMAPSFLKRKDLNFIKKVKDHAKKLGFPDARVSSSDISYYRFNQLNDKLEDVVEIDVNKAYWNLAHQLGYIDDSLHQAGLEGEKIGKMTRLIALGSMASKKKVFQFDGSNYHWIGYKFNPVLRSYFFHISLELDIIMQQIFNEIGEKALFYWFDAFFVSADAANFIESTLKRFDLGIKKKEISEIAKMRQGEYEYIKVKDTDKGRPRIRTFWLPNTEADFKEINKLQI